MGYRARSLPARGSGTLTPCLNTCASPSSALASAGSARASGSGRRASPTSSSWSGRPRWAAPGGTTPIPGAPATSRRTCTRSRSRRIPAGRTASPGSQRSGTTWKRSPTATACAAICGSGPRSPRPAGTPARPAGSSGPPAAAWRPTSSSRPRARSPSRACPTYPGSPNSPARCSTQHAGTTAPVSTASGSRWSAPGRPRSRSCPRSSPERPAWCCSSAPRPGCCRAVTGSSRGRKSGSTVTFHRPSAWPAWGTIWSGSPRSPPSSRDRGC